MLISAAAKVCPQAASIAGSSNGNADTSCSGAGGAVGYPAGFVPVGCVVVVTFVVDELGKVDVVGNVAVDPFSSVVGSVVVVGNMVVVVSSASFTTKLNFKPRFPGGTLE